MRTLILKNIFILSCWVCFILAISSCSSRSLEIPGVKDITSPLTEGGNGNDDDGTGTSNSDNDEINYPSMKYYSKVTLDRNNDKCKFSENIFCDMDADQIIMASEYNDDLDECTGHLKNSTKNIKKDLNSKHTSVTTYTRSNVLDMSGPEYSNIKSLFIFVSEGKIESTDKEATEIEEKKVTFNKPVPFLPSNSVSLSSFLQYLEKDVSFSYVYKGYKDRKNNEKDIGITVTISAVKDDIGNINVTLNSEVTTELDKKKNNIHVADFWTTSVFPKIATYQISEDKKIKTITYNSELIMSGNDRSKEGYWDKDNISSQIIDTSLCEYTIKGKTDSFGCK